MAKDGIARRRAVRLGFRAMQISEPGFRSVDAETVASLLRAEAEKPLRGGNAELAHTSLFGDGHLQGRLF